MATFRVAASIRTRAKRHSAVRSAAYQSRERLHDLRRDTPFDFTRQKHDLLHQEILLPDGAPSRFNDRAELWNSVEAAERRKDSRLARSFTVSLPHELPLTENIRLAREWTAENFTSKGYAADIAIHRGEDPRNVHLHVQVPMRTIDANSPTGFARIKERDASLTARKQSLTQWKRSFAEIGNDALEAAGHFPSLSHLSHKARGMERRAMMFVPLSDHKKERTRAPDEIPTGHAAKINHQRRRADRGLPFPKEGTRASPLMQQARSTLRLAVETRTEMVAMHRHFGLDNGHDLVEVHRQWLQRPWHERGLSRLEQLQIDQANRHPAMQRIARLIEFRDRHHELSRGIER